MASLVPGVLQKLLDGMKAAGKPNGDHRSSLLQITDILPGELDEQSLLPKHGFFIKVSDSSDSIYVSLPYDQNDLVLSNKLQLGQYIHLDRLESGSPVPVAIGAKPVSGRRPVTGTPEPMIALRRKGEKTEQCGVKSDLKVRRSCWEINRDGGIEIATSSSISSPVALDFDQCTPAKARPRSCSKFMSPAARASVGGDLLPKFEWKGGKGRESLGFMRKSCVTPNSAKNSRSKSVCQSRIISKAPLMTFNPPSEKIPPLKSAVEASQPPLSRCGDSSMFSSNGGPGSGSTMNLPGKLGIIGKEALQQRESAQKTAIQALRDASATENIVRSLEMFADLSKRSKPEAPAQCLEDYLEFHSHLLQTLTDMASIQSATAAPPPETTDRFHDKENTSTNTSKTRLAVYRSIAVDQRRILRSHSKTSSEASENDENQKPPSASRLSSAIRLGKQIEIEAGSWFMEFLERSTEIGSKKVKAKVAQDLMMKVIGWVETEQCDSKRRPVHPKAAQIIRKLKIRMKNP